VYFLIPKQMSSPHIPTSLCMLSSSEEGSFANATMSVRIPSIALDVIGNNPSLSPHQISSLNALHREMVENAPIRPMSSTCTLEGSKEWQDDWNTHLKNCKWINAPWFISEAYFFRLLLDLTQYASMHYPVHLTLSISIL
jgi:hypothetical protein